jgi:hypothetical protein
MRPDRSRLAVRPGTGESSLDDGVAAKNATSAGERQVLSEAPSGELVDLTVGDLSVEQRVISTDVIRRLCLGPEARDVDARGIRIRGAQVEGLLDLSFCTVPHPLRFEATTFDAVPDLSGAELPAVWLVDCKLPGLQAERISTRDLRLRSSAFSGEVSLLDARIGGLLDCENAVFSNEGADALVADGAEIGGGVDLSGFSASGAVRLTGVRLGGSLECSSATLSNEGGIALSADGAEVRGGVYLRDGFSASGVVWLLLARISGSLECSRATLSNHGGDALVADGAEIEGSVFLDGCSASGEVQLISAKIGGQLNCSGATLSNEGDDALSAEGAEITGSVFLTDGFSATGAVRLSNARIGGRLGCSAATFASEGDDALVAEGAEIARGVFLNEGFSATGAVQLLGAKIGVQLDCSDATFTNEGRDALVAEGAEIGGSVLLRDGFSANGQVQIPKARIGGQLDCSRGTFTNGAWTALTARDATITSALIFRQVHVTGGVDLFRASAAALDDDLGRAHDPLGSWRGVQPLVLDGFAYPRFGPEAKGDSKLRARWLEQTAGFQPGAWQQLIEVYRAQGRDDEATRAAIAMHNDRVKRAGLPSYRRWGRQVLRVTVGHGYRPWLAGVWAAAIIAAFALVVWQWSGMFIPETEGVTGSPQPVAYAADTFLPIVDLGEAGDWMPTGGIRWVDWSVILLGWALSTIFVAGFTRIVRS